MTSLVASAPPRRPDGAAIDARIRLSERSGDSDEALMLRVGAGDHDACRTIVERHLTRIVSFAQRSLGERSEAEDIAQETFLRLWKHASSWRPEARLTTWLHRVALNLCLDRIARRREEPLDPKGQVADGAVPASVKMEEQQIGEHVHRAMQELPETQRMAIALCHYQGMRNLEAAEVMGVSVEALESLLARGRRGLRASLSTAVRDLLGER